MSTPSAVLEPLYRVAERGGRALWIAALVAGPLVVLVRDGYGPSTSINWRARLDRLVAHGEDARAARALEVALSVDRDADSAQMRVALADLYDKSGDQAARTRALRRALELAPSDAAIAVALANALVEAGALDDAAGVLAAASARAPDDVRLAAIAAAARADAAGARGDDGAQHTALLDAVRIAPRDIDTRLALVEWLATHGRATEAHDVVDAGLALIPDEPRLLAARATLPPWRPHAP